MFQLQSPRLIYSSGWLSFGHETHIRGHIELMNYVNVKTKNGV